MSEHVKTLLQRVNPENPHELEELTQVLLRNGYGIPSRACILVRAEFPRTLYLPLDKIGEEGLEKIRFSLGVFQKILDGQDPQGPPKTSGEILGEEEPIMEKIVREVLLRLGGTNKPAEGEELQIENSWRDLSLDPPFCVLEVFDFVKIKGEIRKRREGGGGLQRMLENTFRTVPENQENYTEE